MNASNGRFCLVCQTPLERGRLCATCRAYQPALARRLMLAPVFAIITAALLVLPILHRIHVDQAAPAAEAQPLPATQPVRVTPTPPVTAPGSTPVTTAGVSGGAAHSGQAPAGTGAPGHPATVVAAKPAALTVPGSTTPSKPGAPGPASTPPAKPAAPLNSTGESDAAIKLIAQAESQIEQYKNQAKLHPISERDANVFKIAVKAKCTEALAHGDRALALDPKNSTAWRVRIRSLYMLERKPAAALELGKALAQFPRDPDLKKLQVLVAP